MCCAWAIQDNLAVLPEAHPRGQSDLRDEFRRDLRAFARRLMLTDPQRLNSAADLIRSHRHELEYLADLIRWRLKACPSSPKVDPWSQDDRFFWRFELQGGDLPPGEEGFALSYYNRGQLDRAEAGFRLLTECFGGYADGHNNLGTIALERGDLEAAMASFRRAIELGRGLFPKRIAKKRYWSDHRRTARRDPARRPPPAPPAREEPAGGLRPHARDEKARVRDGKGAGDLPRALPEPPAGREVRGEHASRGQPPHPPPAS
ncbi:MAG: hypothetical protein HY721_21110 [Planctomycetes bacterium]|nr:hypothetical protein [Planctomycetota bacterium]